jgi:hypothetical protein
VHIVRPSISLNEAESIEIILDPDYSHIDYLCL